MTQGVISLSSSPGLPLNASINQGTILRFPVGCSHISPAPLPPAFFCSYPRVFPSTHGDQAFEIHPLQYVFR